MADQPVEAGAHDPVFFLHGDVDGEETAERQDRAPADGEPDEDQRGGDDQYAASRSRRSRGAPASCAKFATTKLADDDYPDESVGSPSPLPAPGLRRARPHRERDLGENPNHRMIRLIAMPQLERTLGSANAIAARDLLRAAVEFGLEDRHGAADEIDPVIRAPSRPRRPPASRPGGRPSSVLPRRAAQNGPRAQWAKPVTGSSSMPMPGAKEARDEIVAGVAALGGDDERAGSSPS